MTERTAYKCKQFRELLDQIIHHPLVLVGIEDDENGDLLELVKLARKLLDEQRGWA